MWLFTFANKFASVEIQLTSVRDSQIYTKSFKQDICALGRGGGREHAVALHTHKVLVLAVVWSSHFLGISSRMNITTMISATAKYELKRKYYALGRPAFVRLGQEVSTN